MPYVIGVDIGGTFTDAFASDGATRVAASKVPSTPPNLIGGFLDAIDGLADELQVSTNALLSDTSYIVHGTTASLNSLVTGDVPQVGFLTTKGHLDALYIMNLEGRYAGQGPDYLMNVPKGRKPAHLVPRKFTRELDERIDRDGRVIVALDRDTTTAAVRELLEMGVGDFAVSLLWSFKNPAHEEAVREIIRELSPEARVSLSSDVNPRIGEYSRGVTTIMNAQVTPRLQEYLSPLQDDLKSRGFSGPVLVMQGTGGALNVNEASGTAITTIGSVLTGGVAGCVQLGKELGHKNIISADMGGTTFLSGLVLNGVPVTATSTILNQFRVNVPMVRVHTIGSGGGAIAWVDAGGNLRVGPRSAGARPGPACYGDSGMEPTITDADLLLGIINPAYFLGGRKKLSRELAERAMREHIAEPLGMSVEDASAAIYAVANAQAADLVRQAVLDAGEDPREFVVYAFGGAGPAHVPNCAADLGVSEVVVPLGSTAATFSAYGLAACDVIITAELSRPSVFPPSTLEINEIYCRLERRLSEQIEQQAVEFVGVTFHREVDLRYNLQMAEVETPVPATEIDVDDLGRIRDVFEELYEHQFGVGSGFRDAGVQAVTYRAFARAKLPVTAQLPPIKKAKAPAEPHHSRRAMLDVAHGWQDVAVYSYADLGHGHVLEGPAIIEADTTTVVVPSGMTGLVDRLGNLSLKCN